MGYKNYTPEEFRRLTDILYNEILPYAEEHNYSLHDCFTKFQESDDKQQQEWRQVLSDLWWCWTGRTILKEIFSQKHGNIPKSERNRWIPEKTRQQVYARDGSKCSICWKTPEDGIQLEIDHIIPVAKGGTADLSNLRVVCSQCNKKRGSRQVTYKKEYNNT